MEGTELKITVYGMKNVLDHLNYTLELRKNASKTTEIAQSEDWRRTIFPKMKRAAAIYEITGLP